ncbi:MAG: trypsin-like peptidase domain-containing protein [Leptospiraceae bacterium]|nr:trypsin-like peptidase domain-containing protein [Leptospiraceae bacterium]
MQGKWKAKGWVLVYLAANLLLFIVLLSASGPVYATEPDNALKIDPGASIVKIEVRSFVYDYTKPWSEPRVQASSGTGFLINKEYILTNAHVVSGAKFIHLSRSNQEREFEGEVVFVAHDCDLAIVRAKKAEFYHGAQPLRIGQRPELGSEINVLGFPIGGDRISITRGIVSRIDMDLYSHSQIDQHLTLQVDAAINPGNSGGPAMQGAEVIGVAFQSLRGGENLGYLIPPSVIQKFLVDVEDGKYDGYIELGVISQDTRNPVLRRAAGLNQAGLASETGVLVTGIMPGSSADGFVRKGDVILEINGHKISQQGDVDLNGSRQPYSMVTDNLQNGARIDLLIWRQNSQQKLHFLARPTNVIAHLRQDYDNPPEYAIFNGMLFQPLNANLMRAAVSAWKDRPELLYRYSYFVRAGIYKQVDEDVVLSYRLGDRNNTYLDRYTRRIVSKVNGKAIRNFHTFLSASRSALDQGQKLVLEFRGEDVPLVITADADAESQARIQQFYGIQKMANQNEK